MTMLFEWLVSNAITASLLAVVALAVGYAFPRRPALAHACWLLVLLKFLTPPIYVFSLGSALETATVPPPAAASIVQPQQTLPAPSGSEVVYSPPEPIFDIDQFASALSPWNQLLGSTSSDIPMSLPEPMPIAPPEQTATVSSPVVPPITLSTWLLSMWNTWAGTLLFIIQCVALLGTTYLLIITLIRMIHFENLLQLARPAPASVNQLMINLAKPLQLKHLPQIVISSGKVGPLLWQRWNTPIIVLPAGLVETLSSEELSTVLAHELTHYRRGDPFWRYLELVAVASYWWLPTSWLASARLRQAEEECCDAAVVAALPDGVNSYAQALVRSLQFVTEPNSPCPALSSGLGPVTLLKRRLSMLPMNVERRLGLRGWLFMMAVAALALPFGVSLAQADDDDPPPPSRNAGATLPPLAPSAPAAPRSGAAGVAAPATPARPATPPAFPTAPAYQPFPGGAAYAAPSSFNPFQGGDDARGSAEFAVREAELELKMKRAKLKQAERTLAVNLKEVSRNKALAKDGSISSTEVDLANAKVGQAEGDVEMARLEIERAELTVEQAKRRMSGMRGAPSSTPSAPPAMRGGGGRGPVGTDGIAPGGASGGFGGGGSLPPTPPPGGGGAGFGGLPPGAPGGGGGGFGGGSFPPGGPGGFGGRASSDPFFRNFDRRGTGKIERNDVPEWMRERFFETLDSNKDGTVDQAEFNEGYSKFWGANPGPAGARGGMATGGGGIGRGGMAGGLGGGRGGASAGSAPARANNARGERDPRDERIEQLEKELNDLRSMLEGLKKKDPIR